EVVVTVQEDGVVRGRVAGFGLWRAISGRLEAGDPLTRYAAPEVFEDPTRLDLRSDIFSLGCLLYEMLCGQPAFLDRPRTAEQGGPNYEPVATRVACPLGIAAAIERALELDPRDRFADIFEFAGALFPEEREATEPFGVVDVPKPVGHPEVK